MNRLSRFTAALSLVVAATFSSLAFGAEETRDVTGFSSIVFAGAGKLDVEIGDRYSVALSGDESTLKRIVTEIRDGDTLYLGPKRRQWRWFDSDDFDRRDQFHARATLPKLMDFVLAGRADVTVRGLNGGEVDFVLAGAGNLQASGTLDRAKVVVTGKGDARLLDLKTQDAEVVVVGKGNIDVNVARHLEAVIVGRGDITYDGDPKVEKAVIGSGDIRRR